MTRERTEGYSARLLCWVGFVASWAYVLTGLAAVVG